MLKNFLALFAVLCMAVGAHAGTTTSFPLVSNGVFDNGGLAGFSTYAMRVTSTTDWTNADLEISLSEGSLNHVAPAFLGSTVGVNGLGDTAGLAPTAVLADLTGGFNGTFSSAGAHVESATDFSSSWFTTAGGDIGTFDIGMITLSSDAVGTIAYRTIAGSAVENGGWAGSPATFRIEGGAIVVPEPTSLMLASLGLIPMFLRRRS
ncbi:MAG: PEP-CTERM sorting domain-containing protein [Pirellulales bacterium]|nr:PEP-CTERM sorting domain-containing protein [Pirellulales bacterium]